MYLVAECPKCRATQGIFTKKSVADAILYCKICEKRSKLTKEELINNLENITLNRVCKVMIGVTDRILKLGEEK